jgi:hypothetical protein
MKYRTRTYYIAQQKALMWERWRKGDSLQQIAQLFDRNHSSVEGILSRTGGIEPRRRHRSRRALTLAEREEISRVRSRGLVLPFVFSAYPQVKTRRLHHLPRKPLRNSFLHSIQQCRQLFKQVR